MFSTGLTFSARAEQKDIPRQAQQVYAYTAYFSCGSPLAPGHHGALGEVFTLYIPDTATVFYVNMLHCRVTQSLSSGLMVLKFSCNPLSLQSVLQKYLRVP